MRTTESIIIALLMLFAPLICKAQTYSGVVVDENGKTLKGVSVALKNEKGSTITFTTTDSDGHFSLSKPEGKEANSLQFSYMGFAKEIIMLTDFSEGQTIALHEKTLMLEEVKVKSKRIREHGDTIDYLVSNYKEKHDRSIADVIAKMAGMTVKQDGTILYQGKPINKFYIEGMDLLGGKYAIASENLSADKVKKVQVYEKHQPVKSLKDASFSEQAAINIVLTDDAKNVWQGVVDAGLGHTLQGSGNLLREIRLMGMLFSKKKQSLSMYKSSNAGKSPEQELTSKTMLFEHTPTESSPLTDISTGGTGLDESRSKFNDAHVVATNWLFAPRKEHEMRIQLTGLYDRIEQEQKRQTIYTNIEGEPMLTEESDACKYKTEYNGEITYTINNERFYFMNKLTANADFNRSNGNIMLNGKRQHESVKPRKRYITDFMRFNNKLKNGKFVSATTYFSYNYLPGLILLANNTHERLNMHSTMWNASTGYRHRLLGLDFDYKTGVDLLSQRLSTDNFIAQAKDRYSSFKLFVIPAIEYKNDYIKTRVSADIDLNFRSLNGKSKNKLTAEPNLMLQYKPTAKWQFSFFYKYNWIPMEIRTINGTPIFYSYNSMKKGTGNLEHVTSHNFSTSAEFKNTLKELFANASFSYSNSRNSIMYENEIDTTYFFYITMPSQHRTQSSNYSLNGSISKGFDWVRLNIRLSGSYNWNNYEMRISEKIVAAQSQTANANLGISIRPFRWLSVSERSSINMSRQHSRNYRNLSEMTLWNYYQNLRINLYTGSWVLSWTNELYHSNDKTVSTSCFSDIWLAYKKKKYDIGITLNNIFGKQTYDRRVIMDTQRIYTSTRLRPREIIFRLAVNL